MIYLYKMASLLVQQFEAVFKRLSLCQYTQMRVRTDLDTVSHTYIFVCEVVSLKL